MTRLNAIVGTLTLAALTLALLSGCAPDAHSTPQAVLAAQDTLTVAERLGLAVAPLLSPADLATLKRLDRQAYDAKQPVVAAAQGPNGASAAQLQVAAEAMLALTTFLATHPAGI